jgi:hypothetical protein
MTVGAQHDALRELRQDLLPPASDAVLADAERFVAGISMVEFKQRRGTDACAARAAAAHVLDSPCLRGASDDDHRITTCIANGMAKAMAVGTKQVALRSLGQKTRLRSHERSNAEFLRRRIAMMELEGRGGEVVAAGLAPAAPRLDQLGPEPLPPLLLVAVDLRIAAPTPLLSLSSSGVARPGGDFEVLWSPNGEHVRQKRRV